MLDDILMALPGALLIFALRICDVSIGTVRSIYTIRGKKFTSMVLGLFESGIFIFAVSGVLSGGRDPVKMVAYACGFATGIFIGMTIEQWIASGWVMIRVVSREACYELVDALRADGEAVTVLQGEGRDGPVPVLFVVARRKRAKAVLRLVREITPRAFVTVDSVGEAIGGTATTGLPHLPHGALVRK